MPQSRSDRVLWTLYELRLQNQTTLRRIDILKGEQSSLSSMNIMAQVPVLVMTERNSGAQTIMTESCAIVAFLAEQCVALAPAMDDFQARAQYLRMMTYAATTLDDLVFTVFRHERLFPEHMRDAKLATYSRRMFSKRARRVVEEAVKDGWIAGEFSGADICVGYVLIFAQRLGMLDESQLLLDYVRKCKNRDAFRLMTGKKATTVAAKL